MCNGDDLRVAGQAHDAHALGAARQQAYAADVHADYRAVVGDDEQILVAGDDDDVCDGAGLIGDVVVFKSHAAAVLHAVFADVGALAVAVFGYAQYRRALGRDTCADDIVALAQADAAHADRIASSDRARMPFERMFLNADCAVRLTVPLRVTNTR